MDNTLMNRFIDHAVLKPEMTRDEVIKAIKLGIDYQVKTVCVRPCDIDLAVDMCKGTDTEVSCVLGFPHGVGLSEIKGEEAKLYIKKGVNEIDMVVNYSYIRSAQWDLVEDDIKAVSDITKSAGITLKVILETGMLTLEEIKNATEIAIKAKADFVKSSTGFNGGGATVEAIEVMLKASAGRIKVKASGGIRDSQRAKLFLNLGCERLGANYSSTPIICNGGEVKDDSSKY
ncbi:MAG TPA: deoxyribose-phosphate aldolase [Clostridiaceae bacterium]